MLRTSKLMIVKTNINAKNKQINDCSNQPSMLRTSKLMIVKTNTNVKNKQITDCIINECPKNRSYLCDFQKLIYSSASV